MERPDRANAVGPPSDQSRSPAESEPTIRLAISRLLMKPVPVSCVNSHSRSRDPRRGAAYFPTERDANSVPLQNRGIWSVSVRTLSAMIEVRYDHGVYLPAHDLWLDPWEAKRFAF